MDPSIVVAIIALLSSLGGVFIANRYTARTARAAALTTREMEDKKLDIASWQDQVKSWREDVAQLREMRAADKREFDLEIAECQQRISELEREQRFNMRALATTRMRMDTLLAWSRIVVGLMTQARMTFPPLPAGVEDTHPGGIPPVPDPQT